MSHRALRRVMIRLLHDPAFVVAVYADAETALATVDLTAVERRNLLATPRAAWSTDPERPARVFAGLREEFSISLGIRPRGPQEFFASAAFHHAVQTRGSLAAALGAFLATDAPPDVAALVQIEAAIAAVRRAPHHPPPSPDDHRGLPPWAAVVVVPLGTSARYERLRRGPAAAPATDRTEHLLVLRPGATSEVTIEDLPETLAELLLTARQPRPWAELVRTAYALGADPGDGEFIVAGLEKDGLLR